MTPGPLAAAGLLALLASAGCRGEQRAGVVRLGYFPNLTHAPAIAGLREGFFGSELEPGVTLESRVFNAGPEAVEALFTGALDIAYLGPNPAINAFVQSQGQAIRIIAGATSGGVSLVVKPEITAPDRLRGTRLATPQLGNTQDVALRTWLARQGLTATRDGGGDVAIVPQPNAQTLETFRAGQIDGAWVPEPWASRLVLEGGGTVLVDERLLWPGGQFVTTLVVVRTAFLREQPGLVARLLRGHVHAVDFLNGEAARGRTVVNEGLAALTGRALGDSVLTRAWGNLAFTVDPLAASLQASARAAQQAGLLREGSLAGIYDLAPLNSVLAAAGRPRLADPATP
jgi:NitT/TauT family transport system substrate-binding protein